MTPETFFQKVKEYKSKAHTLLEDKRNFNITRGMAHSISGYVEDLFSVYIASNVNRTDIHYFVDKVVSYKPEPNSKAKSFKPDLLLVDNGVATQYCDMKTDLGFSRDFGDYLREKHNFIEQLRGRQAWISFPDRTISISISNEIKYRVVVVFGWNISDELLQRNIRIADDLQNVELYVLFKPIAKNDKSTEDNVTVSQQDFNRISKAFNFNQ